MTFYSTSSNEEQQQIFKIQQLEAQKNAKLVSIRKEVAQESVEERIDYANFNPFALKKKFQTLEKKFNRSELYQHVEDTEIESIDKVSEIAEHFQKKNPELSKNTLIILRSYLSPDDNIDTLRTKLSRIYPDVYLASEALDFLDQTLGTNNPLKGKIQTIKEEYAVNYEKEIKIGKNISTEARDFSERGLGSPTALRDLYREVVSNPREPLDFFNELNQNFTFEKMHVVLRYILHSLGRDIKSKGPTISHDELSRLFSNTRTMQSILGVYRFFYSRMSLLNNEFGRKGLDFPKHLTFELISKQFFLFLNERYPTPTRLLGFRDALGLSAELFASILVFYQYRDSLRNISPRLFKSDRKKNEFFESIIETIEELEEELEEEEEE